MDRVVGLVRVGRVALGAVDADLGVEAAAAADLDDVAEGLRVGGLADEAEVRDFAVGLHPVEHADGAVGGRAFFVAGDEEADRALEDGGVGGRGGDEGGDAALHVAGAAADEVAVYHVAGEGVGGPAGGAGRDDIGVAGKAEMGGGSAEAGVEVGGAAEWKVVHREAEAAQGGVEHVLRAVIGGGDGAAADQGLGEWKGIAQRMRLHHVNRAATR